MKAEDLAVEEWADEDQEKRMEDARAKRDQELADLRAFMSVQNGRRILLRILTTTGLFRQSYTGNANTYFKEGQRSIGLWLFSEILQAAEASDPVAWLVKESGLWALKEQQEAKRNGERRGR